MPGRSRPLEGESLRCVQETPVTVLGLCAGMEPTSFGNHCLRRTVLQEVRSSTLPLRQGLSDPLWLALLVGVIVAL